MPIEDPESPAAPVALCLAGGGLAGAFFELGAVAALEAGLSGWRAARSRVIVGTSCGAVAGALLALGFPPAQTPAALTDRTHPLAPRLADFSRFLWGGHLRAGGGTLAAAPRILRRVRDGEGPLWSEAAREFHRRLPGGLASNAGVADFIRSVAGHFGAEDRFESLPVPLRVTALDLDAGARAVFGAGAGRSPISLAVQASCAIPGFIEPVRIGGRDHVDGQIVDPVHLDLTAGFGVELVVAVNPLTPFRRSGAAAADAEPHVRALGVGAILEQMSRVSAEVKLEASRARFRREHPGVRLLEVAASAADAGELMGAGERPPSPVRIWRRGLAAAVRALEARAAELETILDPYGIRFDAAALAGAVQASERADFPPGSPSSSSSSAASSGDSR